MKTRNHFSNWLALLAVLLAPVIAQAELLFTVNPDGTTVTLTGATDSPPNLIIPSTFEGKTVTRIGDGALQFSLNPTPLPIGNLILFSVTIPDTVTNIGPKAFIGQIALRKVEFGSGVKSIGAGAFSGCFALGEAGNVITIPDSVTTIGKQAFMNCPIVAYMEIGSGVTSVGDEAFAGCSRLTSIHFTGNAPALGGPDVFSGATSATVYYDLGTSGWSPTFGGRPTEVYVSGYPFIVSVSNGEITILGYVGPGGSVTIPGTIGGNPVVAIAPGAFGPPNSQNFLQITNLTLPDGLKTIGAEAFYYTSTPTLTIPASVTNIGSLAFNPVLRGAFFAGSPPAYNRGQLSGLHFHLPGAPGWGGTGVREGFLAYPYICEIISNKVSIEVYLGRDETLVIPPTINGLPVVAVDPSAFLGTFTANGLLPLTLTSITIPPSFTSLEVRNFFDSPSLTSVYFQGNAPSINTMSLLGVASNSWNAVFPSSTTIYYRAGSAGWEEPPPNPLPPIPLVAIDMPWDPPTPFQLSLSAGQLTITGYSGPGGAVNIPAFIGGFPVLTVGASAFAGSAITSVTISEGVLGIGDYAFKGCLGLTTLNLPDSLTSIGAGSPYGQSFSLCANLVSVTFGTNFNYLGNSIFTGCSSLQSLYFRGTGVPYNPPQNYFSPSTTVFYPVGGNAGTWSSTFADATVAPWDPSGNFLIQLSGGTITITGYSGASGAANIPNQIGGLPVTAIAPNAFQNSALTSITIPDSVTSIGDSAFAQCTSLGSVTMGNGVTNVGVQAFYGCTGLNIVNFGSGVTTLGDRALGQCNLLSIFLPANLKTLGADCFSGTPAHSIYFKGNAPTVPGNLVFSGTSATLYYVPGSTGWGAMGAPFAGRPTALWSDLVPCRLVLENGVLSVSTYVAINGGPGAAVTIPSVIGGYPVTSIGQSAFPGVPIASLTLPESVLNIGNSAFQGCTFLKSINLGNGVTNIGQFAFSSSGLETLILPASLKSLSSTAFSFATLLSSIHFQGHAPSIDSSVLSDTSATLYYTLGSTGWGNLGSSFAGRPTGLWSPEVPCIIKYSSGQVSIDRYIGSGGAVNLPSVLGGYPVTKILTGAFSGAPLTSLFIPASVTNLESVCINSCPQLTSIYFPGSAPAFGANAIVSTPATLYYLHADASWASSVAGRPALLWNPFLEVSSPGLGVQGDQFILRITGGADLPIAVEACTNLANPVWQRLQTGTLTNGLMQFTDPAYLANPSRFYRVSAP